MKKSITSFLIFALAFAMQAQTSQEIPSASTVGTLTVTATTVTFKGDHAPKNYLAVWITNSSGAYVKTLLAYYGGSHVSDLTSWVSSNPSKDKTDATTGATLSSHAQRTTTWDGTNASKLLQADGNYTVKFEMTEN